MRPSRFTDAQIENALRQVREGEPAVDMCRSMGVTQTTFYRWRKKFDLPAEPDGDEMRRLRTENHKLKELVAELMLENRA